MDKGLDIAAQRELLAYHAALNGDLRPYLAAARAERRDDTSLCASILRHLRASTVVPCRDAGARALAWAAGPARRLLLLGDADYPAQLAAIAQPPVVLFVAGEAATLGAAQIAIVGSRNASPAGCEFATALAAELAAHGIVTTSGLALGIDGAAHRGALSAGATVAVLGCGIDRTYPGRHRRLADDIVRQGALVSEFPLGVAPRPPHFPQRNRIISGLAVGTVVVEAALRSGSLSTALHALEQGREVFAVPGSINNPTARGCHALLRQGAKLTESVADILQEFPYLVRATPAVGARGAAPSELPAGANKLLSACGWDPFTIDDIVGRSRLTVQEVSSMLLALELAGLIHVQASGSYVRIR